MELMVMGLLLGRPPCRPSRYALRASRLSRHDSQLRVDHHDHTHFIGQTRLQGRWPTLILVHLPVHASWLNQVEIYHSIIQRKLLDPNDFEDTAALARALNDFEHRYNEIAEPFDWNFTRQDLTALFERLEDPQEKPRLSLAA